MDLAGNPVCSENGRLYSEGGDLQLQELLRRSDGGHRPILRLVGIPSVFHRSIVGKNGSGKSAFLDAICWVLGFRSQSIRSENVHQLLNDRARSEGQTETYIYP